MRQRYEYLSPRSNPAVIFGCPLLHHSWADPPSWAARARIVLADLKVLRTGGRPSHLIFREPRKANLRESPKGEVRRTPLPRTRVNSVGCSDGTQARGPSLARGCTALRRSYRSPGRPHRVGGSGVPPSGARRGLQIRCPPSRRPQPRHQPANRPQCPADSWWYVGPRTPPSPTARCGRHDFRSRIRRVRRCRTRTPHLGTHVGAVHPGAAGGRRYGADNRGVPTARRTRLAARLSAVASGRRSTLWAGYRNG